VNVIDRDGNARLAVFCWVERRLFPFGWRYRK
jgi:hypothetical protein